LLLVFFEIANGSRSSGEFFVKKRYRLPFASDTNATDVGDLTVARFAAAGQLPLMTFCCYYPRQIPNPQLQQL
jgi:hypothetical protein